MACVSTGSSENPHFWQNRPEVARRGKPLNRRERGENPQRSRRRAGLIALVHLSQLLSADYFEELRELSRRLRASVSWSGVMRDSSSVTLASACWAPLRCA